MLQTVDVELVCRYSRFRPTCLTVRFSGCMNLLKSVALLSSAILGRVLHGLQEQINGNLAGIRLRLVLNTLLLALQGPSPSPGRQGWT